MTDTFFDRISPELAKRVWPKDAAKHLQRTLGVTWHTARTFLRDGIPAHRREQVAEAIEAELDALEVKAQQLRAEARRLRGEG